MSKVLKVMASVLLAAVLLGFAAGPAMAFDVTPDACWSNSCAGGGTDP